MAPPFRVAEFDILYGKGISKIGEIIDFAVALDIVKKSGSWFSYDGERIGQGKDNVRKFLEENPPICEEIEAKIRAMKDQTGNLMEDTFDLDEDGEDDVLDFSSLGLDEE